MGDGPHAVSNQQKGSRIPARPLNQPRGLEPGTSASEADALPTVRRGRPTIDSRNRTPACPPKPLAVVIEQLTAAVILEDGVSVSDVYSASLVTQRIIKKTVLCGV